MSEAPVPPTQNLVPLLKLSWKELGFGYLGDRDQTSESPVTHFAKETAKLHTSSTQDLTSTMDAKNAEQGSPGRIHRKCPKQCLVQRNAVITSALPPASPRLHSSISCLRILAAKKEQRCSREKASHLPSIPQFPSVLTHTCSPQISPAVYWQFLLHDYQTHLRWEDAIFLPVGNNILHNIYSHKLIKMQYQKPFYYIQSNNKMMYLLLSHRWKTALCPFMKSNSSLIILYYTLWEDFYLII